MEFRCPYRATDLYVTTAFLKLLNQAHNRYSDLCHVGNQRDAPL